MFFSRYQSLSLFIISLFLNTVICSEQYHSSAPYISPNTFRLNSDHFFDKDSQLIQPRLVQYGDVIFVTPAYLDVFFNVIHPQIKNPYVLHTNKDDCSMPGKFAKYLNDPMILAWFTRNVGCKPHPKLFPVPIGIPNTLPNQEFGSIEVIEKAIAANIPKTHLMYINFRKQTFPSERNLVYKMFADKPYAHVTDILPYNEYLHKLRSSKFVLSPRGNGIDCYRTWEAILMDAIPIVKSSTIDPLFEDLPVLIVNDWKEVTEEFLNETYARMQLKSYHWEKLYIQYWLDQMHSYKK